MVGLSVFVDDEVEYDQRKTVYLAKRRRPTCRGLVLSVVFECNSGSVPVVFCVTDLILM